MPTTTTTIERGNVCVNDKGILFIALNIYAVHRPGVTQEAWYGIGFNGIPIHEKNCAFVANNINEYLRDTYGEDYSQHIADAIN